MPVSKYVYPFPVDGDFQHVFLGKTPQHWLDAAHEKGFALLGRAVDRLHVVLGCKLCGEATLKRISVVLGHNPECPHCIASRRAAAAAKVGAKLLRSDPEGDRHYGVYEFECGHWDRRQHHRVEAAADGGFELSCEVCLEARYDEDATWFRWQLMGQAHRKNLGYRRYEHICGHQQDVAVVNMKYGDVNCAGCVETWASKPSRIYIFEFALPDLPVIKLGYSSNPAVRMKQVEANAGQTCGSVHRDIGMKTGHRAICIEKALHNHIKQHRPELVVPQEDFQDHLKTKSEIYHRRGLGYISGLLDKVEQGWDPSLRCDVE